MTVEPPDLGREWYFDTEADGLYRQQGSIKEMTQFWCFGAVNCTTKEYRYFGVDMGPGSGQTLKDGIEFFEEECDTLIAHNGLDFDYRALVKFAGFRREKVKRCWDSLVAAKAIWPYEVLVGPDLKLVKAGLMPPQMLKRHSLKAWGYRTGCNKDEYTAGFDAFHPDMVPYMEKDCVAGDVLWTLCKRRLGWLTSSGPSSPSNTNTQ